jgi:hypothetical protein
VLLHLGDEEAFTALRQVLDEEDKQLLEQFHYLLQDPGFIEELLTLLLDAANLLGFTQEPDKTSNYIKHCLKDPPPHLKHSKVAPYSRTQSSQLLYIILLRILAKLPAFPDFASQFVKEVSQPHGAEQGGQASPGDTTQSPRRVSRENQRAHESLEQTFKRLHRKYGEDQFMFTAHQVDVAAKGIQYQAMAKNVPVKYITIGQASEEFQIANDTLAAWVADGLLHNVTKVEHPAKPEIGIVLVEPREVMKLKEKVGVGEEAAEPRLITLVEAANKFDLPYETIRNWYRSGRLPEKGREVFGTHGGGKILVDEKEIIRLTNRRTSKRKTPTKRTE